MKLTDPDIRKQIKHLRGDPRFPLSIYTAVQILRYQRTPPKYPFLAKLNGYTDKIEHTVGDHTITVRVKPDEDSKLGDDDVTGWFTDEADGAYTVKNTRRDWASNYDYYHVSTVDKNLIDGDESELPKGISRGMRADYVRYRINDAMNDDANRSYCGVIVTIDGMDDALWGIDILDDDTYLRDVATELIDNILGDTETLEREKDAHWKEIIRINDLIDHTEVIRFGLQENTNG